MTKSTTKFPANKFLSEYSTPLCAILFFFAVCWSGISTAKGMALIAVLFAFIGGIIHFSRLRDRVTIPLIALALFVAMGGISTFYALSGKFALQEFLKLLISFCFAMFILAATPGEGAAPGRKIASILAGSSAIVSVVSIDLLSTRWISTPILGILGSISSDYNLNSDWLTVDTRMNSLFGNPNVFATCAGICVLLSLGLVLSSERKRERIGHLCCLFINAIAFVLAFSMGATTFIAVAFLVYLILEQKERLGSLFILMAETLILVLAATVPIYLTSFGEWDGFEPIPMVCVAIGCVALCLLDRFVGQILGRVLSTHHKIVGGVIVVSLAALVTFCVVAYNTTEPLVLSKDVYSVKRSVDLAPGDYTIQSKTSSPVNVTIAYQNKYHTMMTTSQWLYNASLSNAFFTVPEDSVSVHFYFLSGDSDITIESVTCVGPETASVPLGYRYLPGFIANRVQSLWASHSAIQRTVFFEDGIKLFKQSPTVGLGMGSFENAIRTVQSFSYETKYAHNHYIQTMVETGCIGLILFLAILLSSIIAVLLDRKKGENSHPLTPALGATVVFMAGHALFEVSFSYYASLPFIICSFMLVGLCCGNSISLPRLTKGIKAGVLFASGILVAIFTVFLFQNLSAAVMIAQEPSMDNLSKAAKMDKFEYADYMLSYVVSSSKFPEDLIIQDTALTYAAQLAEMNSNTTPYYLAQFYFSHGHTEEAMEMLKKYLLYVVSDSAAWNRSFDLLIQYADFSESFTAGLTDIVDILNNWNTTNLGSISLNEDAKRLLEIFHLELN